MKRRILDIDWILFGSVIPIVLAGLVTMNSFTTESTQFERQIIWLGVSLVIFFFLGMGDYRFLKRTGVVVAAFSLICVLLSLLFFVGYVSKGSQSWFRLGFFSVEPSDPAQIVLILVLAKYFSRRYVEIKNFKHIIVSGVYTALICLLILVQPDFGGALTIIAIWMGMILVSGISKKHLAIVFLTGAIIFASLWMFVLKPYQKERIMTFINPTADVLGAGYNSTQSMIAVGSGQVLGKGIGYGTQSKLNFLPEYRTDFIFAAFAEEWGFVGVVILIGLYGVVIWRILVNASRGLTNFEVLYGIGVAVFIATHFIVNVGMNIGLMPVTGVTVPFMSYGGSHLVTEFIALGILMGMRRYRRDAHRESVKNELVGIQ